MSEEITETENASLSEEISETENASLSEEKFDLNNVPKSKTLNDLIINLHQAFSHETINIEFVEKLLENYESNRKDWEEYVKYDKHK